MTFLDVNNDSETFKKEKCASAIGRGVMKINKPKSSSIVGNNNYIQDTSQFKNE